MVGQSLHHYTVVEKLGEGGMGVVYKAIDTRLDRAVAIKVLAAEKVHKDPSRRRRFLYEAKAASALNHPNIITVHEAGRCAGVEFIVMELVEGKTLGEEIAGKGMGPRRFLPVAIQIADALAAAHSAGIVHRDLKPGNLMVTGRGLVKVLDFGLAKLVSGAERPGVRATTTAVAADTSPAGTYPYMSPEQAEGRGVDARSDIFSFGAVMYEMLTGRPAFQGESPASVVASILRDDPAPLAGRNGVVPQALEQVIAKCLRKDPERRYQSMADLRVRLTDLREAEERGPEAGSGRGRGPRWKSWRTAAAAGALLAAGWAGLERLPRPAAPASLTAAPLTAYEGTEEYPSWSPDGRMLAFSWDPDSRPGKAWDGDIYVLQVGRGIAPWRLTNHPALEVAPAWSPDGQWIAFLRQGADGWEAILTPATGGTEREISKVASGKVAWSADSQWLVLSSRPRAGAPYRLIAVSIETGERRPLTNPPEGIAGDRNPAISPRGDYLAFSRVRAYGVAEIFLLNLSRDLRPAREERQLTRHLNAVETAWTPDGKELVFTADADGGGFRLFRISISAQEATPFGLGEAGMHPAISRPFQGKSRLAFVRFADRRNIWRIPNTRWSHELKKAERVAGSTLLDDQATASHDGSKMIFVSNRTGGTEIWVARADGSHPVPLTAIHRRCGSPQWSQDDRSVVFDAMVDGATQLFTVPSAGGPTRQLTSGPGEHAFPTWSRDGKWIYYTGNQTGRREIWRIPAEGGEAAQITSDGGEAHAESSSGGKIYYRAGSRLLEKSLPAGETRLVFDGLRPYFRPSVAKGEVYFVDATGRIAAYGETSGRMKKLGSAPKDLGGSFTVTPDGKSFLYTRVHRLEKDLMLVEDFK